MESVNASFVVDLDSWLCDSTKGWAGFVMDVFGRVENPFYAIKGEGQTDDFLQKDVYYL